MSGKLFAACASVGLTLCGCRSLTEERPPETRYENLRPEYRDLAPTPSATWLQFSAGYQTRTAPSDDPVDSGVFLGVLGGIDLSHTVLTPSVELGIGYSSMNVDDVPDVSQIDVWRTTVGMRGTWYLKGWRPYARAGGFLRWSTDDVEDQLDPYATGFYAGVGLDWPYARMLLGPNITYFRALNQDAPGADSEELLFALSATFRL